MVAARMAIAGIAAFTLLTTNALAQVTFSVLHNFGASSNDGQYPATPLVMGNDGVLYGVTNGGGTGVCRGLAGCGIVFSLTQPASGTGPWTESVLYNFMGGSDDGALPSGLSMGSGGVLYGTTDYGGSGPCSFSGSTGCGTVFSLAPPASPGGAWTETVLYNFGGGPGDGAVPRAGVIAGPDGVLYGTTQYGGNGTCTVFLGGCGTVFALTPPAGGPGVPGAWTETLLYQFVNSSTDGANPLSGVVLDKGVLYGTTYMGGSGHGTVYSLTPPPASGAWTEKVLHIFSGSDGSYPEAGVLVKTGSSGTVLYGATYGGGTDSSGTVYSLETKGGPWFEQVLFSFPGDTIGPTGGLTMDAAGLLYGTTALGGINSDGTVFQLRPPAEGSGDAWTQVVLHQFAAGGGAEPYATLTWGSGGILFGTAYLGGARGLGTAFSLQP